ncbi:MAG: acetyl-CoA carboxylase biotin carboxylase subunit [Planctomycetota bacterium]
MFRRVLIANRGEIALRVLRACKELGIETVCVYSEADANALYLRYADETICIGPAPSVNSYLDIPRIISAAEVTDVEAIHPGYGFLSENSHFAEVCASCKIKFIGPEPETIDLVGHKSRARDLAKKAGVPVIPGSDSTIDSEDEAIKVAHKIGYPVMIKAAAGGGGRGMRVAHNDISLVNGFFAARSEAESAFKNSAVYIEKLIEKPRHIEIQILCDEHGHVVHLGERDCSLQRRHQKLVEESPSPILDDKKRREMGDAAVRLAKAANYTNAGTVEFLLDKDHNFYFIEINARIQVEHPVTEMVTGIDLIQEQLRVASGEKLRFSQKEIKVRGSAIECRINAEDPDNNFAPSPGLITMFAPPGGIGVRLDSHAYGGYRIPPHYDSMIGKLIIYRDTRDKTIQAARRALDEFIIEGVKTTIPLHRRILKTLAFVQGAYDTSFIEQRFLAS